MNGHVCPPHLLGEDPNLVVALERLRPSGFRPALDEGFERPIFLLGPAPHVALRCDASNGPFHQGAFIVTEITAPLQLVEQGDDCLVAPAGRGSIADAWPGADVR